MCGCGCGCVGEWVGAAGCTIAIARAVFERAAHVRRCQKRWGALAP